MKVKNGIASSSSLEMIPKMRSGRLAMNASGKNPSATER